MEAIEYKLYTNYTQVISSHTIEYVLSTSYAQVIQQVIQ